MAQQFWLGLADGPSGINLLDRGRVTVLYRGFAAPAPAEGLHERAVTLNLRLSGATVGAWQEVRAEIDRMLASISVEQERLHRTSGVLSVTLDGDTWTFIDVKRGQLDVTELLPGGKDAFAALTLVCLPLFRSSAVQAQNLLSSPVDPTVAAWTRTNVTATAANATAPDGSTTGATLLETTATGAHGISQSVTKGAAAAAAYTGSVYVKANGRTRLRLSLASAGNGARATFDVSAGTIVTAAATYGSGWADASASIVADGDWWRVSVTATSDTATTVTLVLELDNGAGVSYAGNASLGMRVWGMQLEEGGEAGLLLAPTHHDDSIHPAWTEPGYSYESVTTNYNKDAGNLLGGEAWSESGMTETGSQSDPSGGSAASREREATGTTYHCFVTTSYASPTGLPATYTGAFYIKADAGRNTPIVWLSTGNGGPTADDSVYFTVNLTDGSMGSVTTSGSKLSLTSREVIACDSSWWWVRITATVATGTTRLHLGCHPNSTSTYSGNTSYGVYAWRPQIVAGGTIAKPKTTSTVTVDPVDHAEVLIATGKPSGAYIYGVPGDAPAIYRVELDDASTTVALHRVQIGAWSGPSLLLGSIAPYTLAEAGDDAEVVSDGEDYVGTGYARAPIAARWERIGQVALADLVGRRGAVDVVGRVLDLSPNIGQPSSLSLAVTGGAYPVRLGRVTTPGLAAVTSITLGLPTITPGATLVLMAQWLSPDAPTLVGGGLTWTQLSSPGIWGSERWWYVENASQPTSDISLTWGTAVNRYATLTLVEIRGAAASSYERQSTNYIEPRFKTSQVTISVTNTQAHAVILAEGLGLGIINSPFTFPQADDWKIVTSLSSGGVAYKTVTASGANSTTWWRDGKDEGWIARAVSFKAADASGPSITAGDWSVVVTALDVDGKESLPTGAATVTVPSSSSAVSVGWSPPIIGTPATYRIYRNRGSGWAYATVSAPTTTYTFITEAGLTTANPPTVPPPVAAWRLSVALPSGETLWRAQTSVSSRAAGGTWEDIQLGTVPIPAIAAGEGATPEGALLVVEAAHLTGATVGINGLWGFDAGNGQMVAHRARMDATDTPDWVLDTNRDTAPSAWLRDPTTGADAGQPIVKGQLTMEPGNAQIVVRPEVADGVSNLVDADVRIRRVLVTPRWRYLQGSRP